MIIISINKLVYEDDLHKLTFILSFITIRDLILYDIWYKNINQGFIEYLPIK